MHSAHGSNSDIRWSHQASWDFKPAHALWVDETSNAGSPSEDVQPTKQLDMNCGRKLSKQRVRRASGLHRHCSTCMCHSTVPCLANLILAGLACGVNNSCRSHSCRKDMTRPFTHTHRHTHTHPHPPRPTHMQTRLLSLGGRAFNNPANPAATLLQHTRLPLIKLYGRISDLDAAFKAANSAEKCLLIQRECAFGRVLVRCWMRCRQSLDSSPTLPHHRHEFCCCVNLLMTVAARGHVRGRCTPH